MKPTSRSVLKILRYLESIPFTQNSPSSFQPSFYSSCTKALYLLSSLTCLVVLLTFLYIYSSPECE